MDQRRKMIPYIGNGILPAPPSPQVMLMGETGEWAMKTSVIGRERWSNYTIRDRRFGNWKGRVR